MIQNITKIYRSDKDKDGKPLMTKDRRPYVRISIKTQQYGEKWLSGFENFKNQQWREGDQVDIEITKVGDYLNFSQPSALQLLERRVAKLESIIYKEEQPVIDEEDKEVDLKDIPF